MNPLTPMTSPPKLFTLAKVLMRTVFVHYAETSSGFHIRLERLS